MPRANTEKPGSKKIPSASPSKLGTGVDDLVLFGDVESYKYVFVSSQRKLISLSVPDSILVKLQAYPGGVSKFLEDTVASFNGDLRTLVEASIKFVEGRRTRAPSDPARNASVRVLPGTFSKIQQIHSALSSIRGMSRAKVLAGMVQLGLEKI
jgi:hypothetical protein